MIEMSVGENDGVDALGVDEERRPVAQAQLLVALEQTAIDEDALSVGFEQIFRSGDGSDGAQKSQIQCHPPLRNRCSCPLKLEASNHLQGVQSLICIKIAPPGWIIVILQFSRHLTDGPAVASMQAIGYRHMVEYLAGLRSWEETVQLLARDTRRYAKRQYTWFRNDPAITWFDRSREEEIVDFVTRYLEESEEVGGRSKGVKN